MKKKLLVPLLLILAALGTQAQSPNYTTTPNLGLKKPNQGATNYGTLINGDFDIIDNIAATGTSKILAVPFSAAPNFNVQLGGIFTMTLTGNVTSGTTTIPVSGPGRIVDFYLCQDATGGRSFVWPSNFADKPSISQIASTCTAIPFFYGTDNKWHQWASASVGTNVYLANATITAGQILKLDSTGKAVPVVTADTAGAIGVAQAGASAGGVIVVATIGTVLTDLDGACTAGQSVIISPTLGGAGNCTSTPGSAQVIGKSAQNIGGAQAAQVSLNLIGTGGGGGSGPGGNTNTFQINGGSSTFAPGLVSQDAAGTTIFGAGSFLFKGQNPYTDITMYNARAAVNMQTTCTISATSTNCVLASDPGFSNGDGVRINGAGANNTLPTPAAPTVIPSLTVVAMETGHTVPSAAGSTSYSYTIVARDKNGGLTAQSPAGTTTNGQASLGATAFTNSTLTRANNVVTVVTSSPHNILVGCVGTACNADVFEENSTDASFSGHFPVTSAPNNTTFTYTQGMDTRAGATTSATGGTSTVYVSNHIVMPALGSAYQYYIYRGGTLVGAARPGETTWDDYGVTAPSLPDFVPTSAPSVATNDYLVTTIASGAGTTSLTLANAAINSVTTATIKKDDSPNILAAATAASTSGTKSSLRIPSTDGTCFTVNSHLILPVTITVQMAGCLTLNETVEVGAGETWTGVMGGSSGTTPQFSWGPGRAINVGTAYPGLSTANGQGTYRDLTLSVLNQGLGMTIGPNLGGNFNETFDHFNCGTGSGGLDVLGQCIVGYGISGVYFQTSSFISSGAVTYGYSTAPLVFLRNDIVNVNPSGNIHFYHPFFTNRGFAIDSNPALGSGNKVVFDQSDSQGIRMPLIMVGTLNGPSIYINGAINDTSTQAFLANMGANGMQATLLNTLSLSAEAGGTPGLVTGSVIPGLEVTSGATSVGQNTSLFRSRSSISLNLPTYGFGKYGDFTFGGQVHFPAQTDLFWDMQPPSGLACTIAAGGSVPVGSFTIQITSNDPLGGESKLSTAITCVTTSGNQTINLTWTPEQGAVSYNLYDNGLQRFANAVTTSNFSLSTNPGCCSNNAPTSTSAGLTGANQTGIFGPQLILTSPIGANAASFTGTLTAPINSAQTWTFPDASGVLCLTTTCGGNFYQTIQDNLVAQTQRPVFNIIPGANMTITCVDNAGNTSTDCTFIASSTASTAWSSLTASTLSAAGTFVSTGNSWDFSGASSFKLPSVGAIFPGSSSGNVTVVAQSAAGTPTITFGTSSGTPAVTASSPLGITTATGNITCVTCATTTNGGALSGTAPIAISVAGAISISAATTGALGSIELAGNLGGTGSSPTVVATTITGFTQNKIVKFDSGGNLINSTASDTGNLYTIPEPLDLTSNALLTEVANASSTGTTVNKFASLTGAPSTAIITTAAATGAIGIVSGGAGTTGSAQIATLGQVNCVFDGATTAGHFVSQSATINGDCTDAGTTAPAKMPTIIVQSTNAGTGTYAVLILGGGGSAGSGAGTVNTCSVSTGAIANYVTSGTAVDCVPTIKATTGNLAVGIAGTTGGTIQQSGGTSGTITFQTQNAAGTYNWNWPITAGTSTFLLASAGGVSAPMTWVSPTITIDGISCTLAGICTTLTIDTNGAANTSQNLIDFRTSTGNTIGLTNTPSNPSGGRELFEISGTLTPTGGGTGISAPAAHSLLVTEGSSNMSLVTSPIVNGQYVCGFTVVASAAVDPTCNLIGVPIDAQTGTTYTIGTIDRSGVITASNSGAQTYTAVNPATAGFTSNFPYIIKNIGTGAVTETSSGFNVGSGTSLLIPGKWTAFHWSDNVNYIVSRFPDFGAFPTCADTAGNHLNFDPTTGVFSCGTSASTGGGTVTLIHTTSPITGGDITATGTIACATCVTSAAAETLNAVVIGGGLQATSTIAADATTTHALFATAGAPAFRAIVIGDLPSIPLNDVVSPTGAISAIALGDNPVSFTTAQATASQVGFKISEATAAISTGTPYNAEISTLIGSTASPLKIDNSLNGSQVLCTLCIFPTWNTTGVVDAGILMKVTNTASGTSSLLIDLQVTNVSQFSVDKSGNGTFASSIAAASAAITGAISGASVSLSETTAPSGSAGKDICYGDSTLHGVKCSFNNGSFLNAPLETGTMTAGHLVSVNTTTNLLQDSTLVASSVCAPNAFASQTDGATVTWAIGSAMCANASLTFTVHSGSRTLNITNPVNGGQYTIWLKQDTTGGEGLTLGTGCTWKVVGGGSGAVTPSTGANAIDVLSFTFDGSSCFATFGKNYN